MSERIAREDLARWVGRRIGPASPLLVGQDRIGGFADVTEDHQWIHVDVDRASREAGGTIAHGYLVLSLVPQFMARLLTITGVGHALNYGVNKVRFLRPVRSGSSLHAYLTVTDCSPRGEGLLLTTHIEIIADGDTAPACVAEALTLLFAGDGEL